MNIGDLTAVLGLDTSGFQKEMDTTQKKLEGTSRQMQSAGKKLSMFLTLPLLGVGAAASKMAMDFENSMASIVGLVGVSKDVVDSWKSDVQQLSMEVGKSSLELADALYFITGAGIKGKEALEILEMSGKAAASGLGETKVIADLLTSALNAYGTESLSAAQATDILVAAVRDGKAEADALAASMGGVLPLASEMGVSFDQVGAAFAAMTRTGTNAAEAATAINAILAAILKPAKDAEKALNSMGSSSEELRRVIREDGLAAALTQLREITNEYGEDTMARVIPNIRALKGVLDLMGANTESNIAIFESLKNSTGAADFAFETISKTGKFGFNQMLISVKTSLLAVGESIMQIMLPAFTAIGNAFKSLHAWYSGLSEGGKSLVLTIGGILVVIGPTVLAIGSLVKVFALLRAGVLATNLAFMASPLGLIITGIAAVVVAFQTRWKPTIKEVVNYQEKFNESLKTEQSELLGLVTALKLSNPESETRKELIKQLNEKYGEYLPNMLTEKATLGDIDVAYRAVNSQLVKKIALQSRSEQLNALAKDALDLEQTALLGLAETTGIQMNFITAAFGDAMRSNGENMVNTIQALLKTAKLSADPFGAAFQFVSQTFGDLLRNQQNVEKEGKKIIQQFDYLLGIDAEIQTPKKTPGGGLPPPTDLTAYEQLQQKIEETAKKISDLTTKSIQKGGKGVSETINKLKQDLLEYQTQLENIDKAMLIPGAVFEELKTQLIDSGQKLALQGKDEIESLKIQSGWKIALLQNEMETRRGIYAAGSAQWLAITEQYSGLEAQIVADTANWIKVQEKEKLDEKIKTYKEGVTGLKESLMTEKEYLKYSYDNQVKWVNEAIRLLVLPVDVGAQLIGKLTTKLEKDLEKIELDETGIEKWEDRWKSAAESIQSSINQAVSSIVDNMVNGIAESSTIGDIFADVLGTLADLAIQVGKIALTTGLAIEGIKTALKSLDPALAITAGIALIGLGTWAKGKLADTGGTLSTSGDNNKGFQSYIYNGGFQGLATGGIVKKSGMFTVGEAGRENVYLPVGAAVVPNGGDFSDWKMAGRLYGRDMVLMLKREQSKYKRRG